MAGPNNAAGVYSGVGGVFDRNYGDAHGDSGARSDHAESCGSECCRSEPDTAVARAGAARRGPDLQRPADQRGGTADTAVGLADESVAAGACGAEPGAAAIADSAARGQFAPSFPNRTAAGWIAGGGSFRCSDAGPATGCSSDSEPEARCGSGYAASGRTGFARASCNRLREATPARAQ